MRYKILYPSKIWRLEFQVAHPNFMTNKKGAVICRWDGLAYAVYDLPIHWYIARSFYVSIKTLSWRSTGNIVVGLMKYDQSKAFETQVNDSTYIWIADTKLYLFN